MKQPLIGFAGMTHLGVNSLAGALARDFSVMGYDRNTDVIDGLRNGNAPVVEPDLTETLAEHAAKAEYSSDIDALSRCDVVYIATDVPTDDIGASDLSGIRALNRRGLEGAVEGSNTGRALPSATGIHARSILSVRTFVLPSRDFGVRAGSVEGNESGTLHRRLR